MSTPTWASWAEDFLRANWRNAVSSALTDTSIARWHPTGFIVFRLGEVRGDGYEGSHRVHVWPGGIERRLMAGHPSIHSHDWELQSLALSGEYVDDIFRTSTDEEPLLAHHVQYGGAAGDTIAPTGEAVRLIRHDRRIIPPGTCHHMLIGVPHETLIADAQTVVTYVMMSPRQPEGMVLLGGAAFSAAGFQRPGLTEDEQAYAAKTLSSVLEDPPPSLI